MGKSVIFVTGVSFMRGQIPELSGCLAMGGSFSQTVAVNLDQLLVCVCNLSLNACDFLHTDMF